MSGQHSREGSEAGPRLGGLLAVLLAAALVLVIVTLFRGSGSSEITTTTAVAAATTSSSSTPSTTAETSTTAADASTTAPVTTLADPLSDLVLTETGIGAVRFGAEADDAISQLAVALGDPTEDTGWTSAFETCPGPEARIVRWTSLQAFFTNGATDWAPQGTRHFFHYGNSITAGGGELIELRTSAGIAVGDSIGELKAAYGDRVTVSDDPLFGPLWEVQVEGAGALWGTAGTSGDQGMIDSINGGPGCGE
jgi:hypothetical protein